MTAPPAPPPTGRFSPWWPLTGLYLLVAVPLVVVRPGWYDEWFTIALARLPAGGQWTALGAATDMNPPLLYWIEKPFLATGLPDVMAARLPSVLAFYLLLFGLYRFVAARGHRGGGVVAVLVAVVSAAFAYAAEARPYALVLGACGGALLAWPAACAGRGWGRLGLAASVAAAVSSHYYGLLAVLPFFVGEFVRTVQARRLDWATAAALVLGLSPLLAWLPLLSAQKEYAGLLGPPSSEFLPDAYKLLFGREILPALAGLGLLAVWPIRPGESSSTVSRPDAAVAVTFVLIPAILLTGAKLTGASVGLRYAAPTVVGAALLVGFAVNRLCHRDTTAWQPLAIGFAACFAVLAARDVAKARAEWSQLQAGFAWASAPEYGSAPVVTAEPLTYPTWRAYAPPGLRERLCYVPDPSAAERYLAGKKYSLDGAYLQLDRFCGPFGLRTLDELTAGRDRVLIYGQPSRGWVAGGLLGRGWTLIKVRGDGMDALYVAERPRRSAP